ncbi:MAG: hypothetical protein ACXVF0_13700 [Blastococcus sp.]
MSPGRLSRVGGAVLLAVLPGALATTGCDRAVDGKATASPAEDLPSSPAELGALIVTRVPSGLPRLPDDQLHPPAGAKTVEDIAGYSDDPGRQRDVLRGYGYRFGWERFWGAASGPPMTGVFVDQFATRAGAGAYAEDLARNEAEHYRGMLRENPPHLPGGCRMLTLARAASGAADPATRLKGPAAFAWCEHGVFSVSVTAVARSAYAADSEVRSVLAQQLDRLPPR